MVHGIQEYRHIQTDSEHEVVEGLFVEVVEGKFHGQSKICQVRKMLPVLN